MARRHKPDNAEETSGTPGYMAPEVICRMDHSYEVDFFALGVILWNLVFVAIVNPNNTEAVIDDQKQAYFPQDVADRIFLASNIVMLSGAVCFIAGSWMVERREGTGEEEKRGLNRASPQADELKTPSDDVLEVSDSSK